MKSTPLKSNERIHEIRSLLNTSIRGLSMIFIVIIACYFAIISTRLFSLCLFLMLPSIITMMIDRSNGRLFSIAICICNLSGILIYLPNALYAFHYHDMEGILNIMMSAQAISVVYGLSFAGFISCIFLPGIYRAVYTQNIRNKKAWDMESLKELKGKWNIESEE